MSIAVPYYAQSSTQAKDSSAILASLKNNQKLNIRSARVQDVHGMSLLINQYASANVMLARGPQYLYQHIQDYVVATVFDEISGEDIVIACGALHVLWEDLAEIRSIAVHRECQGRGFGKTLVETLVNRCKNLGIPNVFVFTLVASFFSICGFKECNRDNLPPFVWVECSKCPKFYRCDEISMIRHLA